MYAISLTTIPPRFHRIKPVLESLLAQDPAPSQVIVCLPRTYRRFPEKFETPVLPNGVRLLWSDTDFGPATKAIPAARVLRGHCRTLIYCDDDWIASPKWAASLLSAHTETHAATGSGYAIDRLGRVTKTQQDCVDIAQGFSGVAISPQWLAEEEVDPPDVAWPVDDIWLSGHLARQGISIRNIPSARAEQSTAYEDQHALQGSTVLGRSRDAANRDCIELLNRRYRIWPAKG